MTNNTKFESRSMPVPLQKSKLALFLRKSHRDFCRVKNVLRIMGSFTRSKGSQIGSLMPQSSLEIKLPTETSMSLQRLSALRAVMAAQPKALAAYIVPTADAHNSEYISPTDARREWISFFTGSAGTAVVTMNSALVWTDGRYYTQFEREADLQHWTLMKQSLPDTPTMEKWLVSNLQEGAVVGADPTTIRKDDWTPLKTALTRANMELIPIKRNLVDEARAQLGDLPPPRPSQPLVVLPVKYTGNPCGKKVEELRKKMVEKKAAALVITALDEVAYTLNLRSSDIEYNPVFFSYLVIRPQTVDLFWQDGTLPSDVRKHFADEGLENVTGRPYEDIEEYLEKLAKEIAAESQHGKTYSIWLTHDGSEAINIAASGGASAKKNHVISEVSPVALMKLVKNEVELKGFRDCHIRDGIALIRFFRWLHDEMEQGREVTEVIVCDKLLEFRKQEADFVGPSFSTIAGAGGHGAVIHYHVDRDKSPTVVGRNDMLLLDSGGQYLDGTTDVTRTRHMSASPTEFQKIAFTRVLKGQIALATALFPKGVKGNVLDSFARQSLWEVGLDYAHGTGHGVGHYLNVHEGPSGVSWRPYPDDPGLDARQILSNEPGYYKVDDFGIRHEDLVEVINVTKDSDHPKAKGLLGDYDGRGVLGFNTITLVPNQRECIDVNLLTDFELKYTNAYHEKVLNTIGPILKQRGLVEDYKWLERECRPLVRE